MAGMMFKAALRLSREVKAVLLGQPQGRRMFCSKSTQFIEYGFDFGRPMFGPYYGITDAPIQSDGLPSYVDWSKVPGVMGKAWDQWPFGICYLCASLSGMSSVNAIATYATTKESVVLSPQHVLDCNTFSIGSIHGGFVWDVLNFAVKNGGILAESVYPLTGMVGVCKRKMGKGVCIDDWMRVKPNCERALRWTLAHQPATVDIRLLDHIKVDGKMIETSAYTTGAIEGPSYYRSNANHSVDFWIWRE